VHSGACFASARPRYGGTLRVMMQARVESLDPRDFPADFAHSAATAHLLSLAYERLVGMDERGEPQPELASSWEHSLDYRFWDFKLRPSVKFHDGAPLTARDVALSLQSFPARAVLAVGADVVRIESEPYTRDFLFRLAEWRYAIVKVPADPSQRSAPEWPVGTGPFQLTSFVAGASAGFSAFAEHWAGRPLVDAVRVTLGVSQREQAIAVEVGNADIGELSPADYRRAVQSERRSWSSLPVEVIALIRSPRFSGRRDAQLVEALSRAIDRASIHSVLLQKQGEVSAALLPQWLSGYAFLFDAARDLDRARQLASALEPSRRNLAVGYPAQDALLQSIAERIAVNGREAGLTVQTRSLEAATDGALTPLLLVRYRIPAAQPALAMNAFFNTLRQEPADLRNSPRTAEGMFEEEKSNVGLFDLIPIAHLPVMFGLSPRVRNWMPTRLGEWRLADVWIDEGAVQGDDRRADEKDRGQAGKPVSREKP